MWTEAGEREGPFLPNTMSSPEVAHLFNAAERPVQVNKCYGVEGVRENHREEVQGEFSVCRTAVVQWERNKLPWRGGLQSRADAAFEPLEGLQCLKGRLI